MPPLATPWNSAVCHISRKPSTLDTSDANPAAGGVAQSTGGPSRACRRAPGRVPEVGAARPHEHDNGAAP